MTPFSFKICSVALLALITGCSPAPEQIQRLSPLETTLPPMNVFPTQRAPAPSRSNADMAQDFMDLSFRMENGAELTHLTRFEGPITIAIRGNTPSSLPIDLAKLISRLQDEAGIDIRRAGSAGSANITVQGISSETLERHQRTAACFVAPNAESWSEYRSNRWSKAARWTELQSREKIAVFIKYDESPQEIRDCLHEEIAQALGPLNDLYRLPDSVFNDDNMVKTLTGFDMLMLRAYYDPALSNGMSRAEVAQKLPAILNRLNPAGAGKPATQKRQTPRSWIDEVEQALGPQNSATKRRAAAKRAVEIATQQGWNDNRRAFSHYLYGQLSISSNGDTALAQLLKADAFYAQSPLTAAHRSHVGVPLTSYALSAGQPNAVIELTNRYLPPLTRNQNAALMAQLMLMKAEALEQLGRPAEARNVRLDSLGWARYGFADSEQVRKWQADIAALPPTIQSDNG